MKFRFCGDLDCPDWVLAEISTLSKLSSVRIKVLTVQILNYCLEGEFNYDKVLKLAADNSDGVSDMKGSVAALHFILTNAAKYGADEKSVIQEIQQLGLPKENAEAVAKQYRECKDALTARFAEETYRVNKLVSVDWRVDQVIASSLDEEENKPLVSIKLGIDTQPDKDHTVQDIAFEMSVEKLQILLYDLKQVQKMIHTIEN